MAAIPTIRLKKTELPVDKAQASRNSADETAELAKRLRAMLDELHLTVEGTLIPGTTMQQKEIFAARVLSNTTSTAMRLHDYGRRSIQKRVTDAGSAHAPWVWKPTQENSTRPDIRRNQKTGSPELLVMNDSTMELRLPLAGICPVLKKTYVGDSVVDKWLAKHPQYRALTKYVRKIDWACIEKGIPVRFRLIHRSNSNTGEGYSFLACIQVTVEATYLSSNYNVTSLLGEKAFSMLPAIHDLAEAKRVFYGKGTAHFHSRPFSVTQFFLPLGKNAATIYPTSAWIEALMSGERGTDKDIRTGKAPLPPGSEIVSLLPVFEHFGEMKKIIKTLMRTAKPYDRISFLPIAG